MEHDKIGGIRRFQPIDTSHETNQTAAPRALLVSLTEAASLLGVSRWTIYQLINRGDLVAVRIDRRRLIARADILVYIERLRAEEAVDGH